MKKCPLAQSDKSELEELRTQIEDGLQSITTLSGRLRQLSIQLEMQRAHFGIMAGVIDNALGEEVFYPDDRRSSW